MRKTQFVLRLNLAIDIKANHVPLDDGALQIAHGSRSGLDPPILAVKPPQTVFARIRFTSGQGMRILLLDPCNIVGMHPCIKRCVQPRLPSSVQIFKIIPEKFPQLLAAIDRLAVWRGAVDHRRQCLDQLPKRSLAFAQRFLDAQLIVDIM
ncbi:hypothetical protein D9M70_426500 [compost metagenome]